ncbi:MAG: 16S rRNA (guanine(527)-N(7))-methyltransferase RsmG [Clostridia bacterium]|nr:16S rRNA (guanine(527)-N(7))-methyltransferase RsmG [Clostridia bacterium]
MDYLSFREYFIRVFQKNGLETYITEEHIRKFYDLTVKMVETNKVMNITALTTMDKIIPLHYADCVKAAALIPQNATVADIGCGGGFPILPLAIVRPDLKLVGIDSTEKKIRYVQNTADELGLSVTAISGRAEDLAKQTDYRDHFDVVISRAVARLNVLDELCMPFVKVGGRFIALKGAAGQEELSEAMNGIQKLGGQLHDTDEYSLFTADDEEKRVMVRIDKISATPKEYPRAFGAIKKKPL